MTAGFSKRIMFGSDAMTWPELIGVSIEIINGAPFLTKEQKADIFYNNAAQFLGLSEYEIKKNTISNETDHIFIFIAVITTNL